MLTLPEINEELNKGNVVFTLPKNVVVIDIDLDYTKFAFLVMGLFPTGLVTRSKNGNIHVYTVDPLWTSVNDKMSQAVETQVQAHEVALWLVNRGINSFIYYGGK